MHISQVDAITQTVFNDGKYTVLCGPTHERIESYIAKTGHNFYGFMKPGVFKPGWNEKFAPIPSNYHLLNPKRGNNQIFPHIVPDMVLSQNKFGQYQILGKLSTLYNVPLISVEHTASMPWWSKEQRKQLREMRGHINVFITNWSLESWDWDDRGDTIVIHHCVDSELFCPDNNIERQKYILTVGNDYIGRAAVLGFATYQNVVLKNNLPAKPVGDTPGLSVAPNSVEELVKEFQNTQIFLNTHNVSPVPTSLLEAASCGCAIVSCRTAGIPEFFTHGENALLYGNDQECLEYLQLLLHDNSLCDKLGKNARQMTLDKCSVDRFVKQWTNVFERAYQL